MIWIGLAIVVVTFYLIYKNYEARLVLALSGLVMAVIGQVVVGTNGGVSAAVDAFVKQLVNGGLVPTIVTVMGFGYVMTFTKCSDHLVNLLVKPLARVPVIVIPGAVIITWLLNIVLPSAAGIAAADAAGQCAGPRRPRARPRHPLRGRGHADARRRRPARPCAVPRRHAAHAPGRLRVVEAGAGPGPACAAGCGDETLTRP